MNKDASNTPMGTEGSMLDMVPGGTRKVPVPWSGNEWRCPNCEKTIPALRTVFLGKPPKYADYLHDVVKCCWCKFAFAPKNEATVLRR